MWFALFDKKKKKKMRKMAESLDEHLAPRTCNLYHFVSPVNSICFKNVDR